MSADTRESLHHVSSKFFPEGVDPELLQFMLENIAAQQELEAGLEFDERGYARISDSLKFVLETRSALVGAKLCSNVIADLREPVESLSILDVGGGLGTFVQELRRLLPGVDIDATVLSLTDFFTKMNKEIPGGLMLKIGSAELPTDDLYKAFDGVVQTSGPLQWSKKPQIVADNMIKMVKPGGFLFYEEIPNYHKAPYGFIHKRLGYGYAMVNNLIHEKVSGVVYQYREVS